VLSPSRATWTARSASVPEPIQISGAELLDRLVGVGALPSASLLPALPGDGAALPEIAATLTSSQNVLQQIAASLSVLRPELAPEGEASQRETIAVLSRLADLLAKAKFGQSFGDIHLMVENDGKDPDELVRDIWRRLDDLRMADLGRTDPLRPG
jgi:hypothetical protein